jgi:hypothetical protein
MSGAVPLVPIYAFMTWTTLFIFLFDFVILIVLVLFVRTVLEIRDIS